MTYDFFADKNDKLEILDFIFKKTDLQVFDTYSLYGTEISEYISANEILSKFDLENGNGSAVTFQLWSPAFKGKYIFRKINLDPTRCNGHTFRYSTDGWGLIQLYLGGLENGQQFHSHIGHQSKKRALTWQHTSNEMGNVNDWAWEEVESVGRKLKYQIHNKMSVKKNGSFGLLKGAASLEGQGIIFR